MKVIGLTGNSGSGKSTICHILKELGGYIIDADRIAHENMEKSGRAYNEIVENFGKEILLSDKNIDRKKLGGIVFSDKEKLKLLNQITHKHVTERIKLEAESIKKANGEYKFIVCDVPLLIESGLYKYTDEVWLVYADMDTRLKRIMKRDGITREQALNRFKNQMAFEEMKGYADYVIENSEGSETEALKKRLLELLSA